MGNRNNRLGQEEAHHQDDPYGDVWRRPEAFLAAHSQPLQAALHQIAEVQIPYFPIFTHSFLCKLQRILTSFCLHVHVVEENLRTR